MTDSIAYKGTIVVSGATGKQGGATARHLLKRRFRVRAMTRNLEQLAAKQLVSLGAELVHADLDDRNSLERAIEGADGLFSVQNFWKVGYEHEIAQGKCLADLAKSFGVRHLIYTSVASCYRKTGIPHWESKWQIEQYIRELGLPYTILRPTSFMDDWVDMKSEIFAGMFAQPLDPQRSLQQIAVDDIGAFAAIAFDNPKEWLGREIALAGDNSSMEEITAAFSRVIGREVQYVQTPWDKFQEKFGDDMTTMYRWFNENDMEADINYLRSIYPSLTTFEQHLVRGGWSTVKE
ncbi:NmrA/HSCARG family protein [Leptolyngbya sp. NK1-12]|uniref:NmrA/HSCARG family protein n=1 Tax=Leptolyngbya sp. NK1-12 TaxID=2547451 RepID=A0AA96WHT9_9CYAN|nr:NmrA/HSCARG family protein [Leptolyngbya sp. NK1-12]WNZ25558.1 NmrA/HSCARG family protein [Leptolyngbya sp. NK1-12]